MAKEKNMKYAMILFASTFVFGVVYFITFYLINADYKIENKRVSGQWRYKMTVIVETPDGEVSGSAVREMGNTTSRIDLPDVGNPANVRGEAVVVDLGERGVLFVLVGSDSDLEFYSTFPEPTGHGGTTPEGIRYYSSLPVGKQKKLGTNRYLKIVTFNDMSDARTVEIIYDAEICAWAQEAKVECVNNKNGTYIKVNRFEDFFGKGVRLKDVILEITDEQVNRGIVANYLPDFDEKFWKWFKALKYDDPRRITEANFK